MEYVSGTKPTEIVVFLTHILGIAESDALEYDNVLKDRGYESISTLIHFLSLEAAKSIMKPDDYTIIEKYFEK